jgi:hypothetical protein
LLLVCSKRAETDTLRLLLRGWSVAPTSDSMPNLPDYLVEAIVRYGAECRAQAQAELRTQMADLLGLREAQRDLPVPTPPKHYGGGPEIQAVQQSYAYGTISKVVKQIMREAPRPGIEIADIIKRAARDWKTPVTKPQARDALKRMKQHGEVDCLDRRKWISLPKLRGEEAPNENEAPATLRHCR